MESLRKLGLTKYESLIYSDLVKNGKGDARKISERSKVPPTAVYPNLKSLLKKKIIHEVKGPISVFGALPCADAINFFVAERQKNISQIGKEAIEYAEQLSNSEHDKEQKEAVLMTYGKVSSADIYVESFDKAKKTFYVLGWKFNEINDKYNLLKGFKKMIRKKADVRIILTGSLDKNWQLIKDYSEEGIKIRYLPLNDFSVFVMDSKECKITLKKPGHERLNIQILDENLSRALNFYFLSSWNHAKELKYDKKSKKIIV